MAKITAVIDFGSNSVRLVIFERTSRFGFKIIHETKSRVRIGEGAYQKGGIIQEEPMRRALLALKSFKSIIEAFKARKTLAVATSALRDAPNRNLFVNRVQKELGINIKVIEGEKEALLGGIATANLLKCERGLTIDIGGGSTEFALIENRKVLQTFSLNLGTVRLKELFDEDLGFENAKRFIRNELEKLPLPISNISLIGIGGTLRALSKIILEKSNYPLERIHGFSYLYKDQKDFIDTILYMSRSELETIGFKRERSDVVRWGILIFKEAIELLKVDRVITSGVGLREGVFLKDILRNMQNRFPENFNPSLRNILDDFGSENEKHSKLSARITSKLFETLQDKFNLSEDDKRVLNYTSKLLEIGVKVDFYGSTKNGFYMVINRLIHGISHEDTILIATLIRFSHKNSLSSKIFNEFGTLLPDYKRVENLHSIIYLTNILSSNYSNEIEIEFDLQDEVLVIKIFDDALFYSINEKLELLQNIKIELKEFF